MRLHIDTDFAGDPDDACAVAMVLGWPDVEVTGITTTADPGGRRAGYLAHFLELAGRPDIAMAAGAGASLTTGGPMGTLPDHQRYWSTPAAPPPRPSPPGAALDLLDASIGQGTTVAAIGPSTNLALLEEARPGRLRGAPVVMMGGWARPLAAGLPAWGPERDWNVQCDTRATTVVAASADVTLVSLSATAKTHLRAVHLDRLAAAGPLGELLARQAQAHAADGRVDELGRAHPALPDDLLNFHHDPLACAVALGWGGAVIEQDRLSPTLDAGVLRFEAHPGGRAARVVVDVDGDAFAERWLASVEALLRRH